MARDTKIILATVGSIIIFMFLIVGPWYYYVTVNEDVYRARFYCDSGLVLTKSTEGFGPKGSFYRSRYICAIPAKMK